MRNIIAKIPGTGTGIVLFATHCDTERIPNFVGADDGGSGTGTMLETGASAVRQQKYFERLDWFLRWRGSPRSVGRQKQCSVGGQ